MLNMRQTIVGALGLCLGTGMAPIHSAYSQALPATMAAQATVEQTCRRCHNDQRRSGNMSLQDFEVARSNERPAVTEKMIRKLRTGLMPPTSIGNRDEIALANLAMTLEAHRDHPDNTPFNPGRRTFQRLNRAEYTRSVRALLSLDITAGNYLPLDTKSANFDNIADVQLLSPTLMNGYLQAASDISRLAVGDPTSTPIEATYKVTRWLSQRERVEGAPYGSRGGISIIHTFPADADYVFRVSFHHETTGELFGSGRGALHTAERSEQVEISVDGERTALIDIDRWMHVSDPDGVNLWTPPLRITAGPHRISAVFVRQFDGPAQDLISPHEWSLASTSVANAYGFTSLPHLRDLAIRGPLNPTGVSETPSRARIFSCRPGHAVEEHLCAEDIINRLGTTAYRRPLTEEELAALLTLYDIGSSDKGFESGIRMALEGVLASPHFVFRFEEPPVDSDPTSPFLISEHDLASRLSFFLWSSGPDKELADLAAANQLSRPDVLVSQTRRMLADPRSEALATRFAAQWLRLPDLERLHPDVRTYPDFDEQLKRAMLRETELFFDYLLRKDRPLLELLTADYTFINERLAKHYGLAQVVGSSHRLVEFPPSESRRGILGHGSILTLTSHPGRTSPVLRGKWVMEVLLGSPPPPPPPNVPDLDDTEVTQDGQALSVRQRMERHRASPSCSSCHLMIDPIGLALEHYDVTGAQRIRDNGVPIDANSELYDGTPLASAADLRTALLARPTPLIRTFTENLMAYALGRRLEPDDMPTVRNIVRAAESRNFKLSAFILGIVRSPAFLMKAGVAEPKQVGVLGSKSPPTRRPPA